MKRKVFHGDENRRKKRQWSRQKCILVPRASIFLVRVGDRELWLVPTHGTILIGCWNTKGIKPGVIFEVNMAECGDTSTKRVSAKKSLVCRTCNQNIVLKNHPVDFHGSKAKPEGIEKDLETFFGLKIPWDDEFPSRMCRSCYLKLSKTREF